MSSANRDEVTLPDGYCLTTIGEVVESRISQEGPTRDFTYLDIGSVDRDSKKFFELKIVTLDGAPSRARQVVQPLDVLVSMTRPNLNAVAMVTDLPGEAIASTGFHVLRSPWVEPKFLFYLVQTEDFIQAMTAVVQGALYPAVRPKDISSFQLGLPPCNEQSRIVEKLEELLSDLDAGVAELKAAQRKLAQYRQSLLKAAVEGALTAAWRAATHDEPQETGAELLQRILSERRARWEQKQLAKFAEQGKRPPQGWQAKYPEPVAPDLAGLPSLPEGWIWASLDQVSASVRNGLSQKPVQEPVGYPILRINAVRPMSVNLDEIRYLEISSEEAGPYLLKNGDLLATRYNGSVDLLGVVGVVRGLSRDTVYPDKLIRIQPVLEEHLAEWIEIAASTGASRAHITSRVKTTAGQTGISGDDLKRMPIPLSSLPEQARIASLIRTAIDGCASQQDSIYRSLAQAAAQRKNLLKTAFAGQLVPQDPNDEPASELLARIRAERASNDDSASRRRRKSA